jgi:hypothetical protein
VATSPGCPAAWRFRRLRRLVVLTLHVFEIRRFELVALEEEQLGVLVDFAALGLERRVVFRRPIERAQVLALVKVHEVDGREEELGIEALHVSSR